MTSQTATNTYLILHWEPFSYPFLSRYHIRVEVNILHTSVNQIIGDKNRSREYSTHQQDLHSVATFEQICLRECVMICCFFRSKAVAFKGPSAERFKRIINMDPSV